MIPTESVSKLIIFPRHNPYVPGYDEQWYFSAVDICWSLVTDSANPA